MLSRFKKKEKTGSLLRAARSGNLEKLIVLLNKKVDVNACDETGLTALHLSAKEGYVAVVKELLKRGARIEAQTKKKNTPLHISCLSGKLEAVKMLVDNGANVNAQSLNGFTPLYMASQEGHIEVVKYLMANKADHNLATDDGFTPRSVALQQGHADVVRFLMEQGSSSRKHNLSALHMAAKTNDTKAIKLLLQNDGVDCNKATRSGFTPLHIASHYGHVDIGLALLQRKADVNSKARNGIAPLHVASKRGHIEMVKLLTSSGADVDAKTMDGMTSLHCSSKSGHHHVIRHLLEKGAKVNARTKHGLTPLHSASQADSAESCKVLLNNKAAINEGTVDNLTPLHVAAHFGNLKSGRLLLEKKCDVDSRSKAGFTPLHVAIIRKKPRMVDLLLRFGANLDAQTASGLSPMHVAAITGSSPIANSILQTGNVDVNSRTCHGDTPLHLAARNNNLDIVSALLHSSAQVDVKGTEHRLTPLHISSQLGQSEVTKLLLQHGASPDSKTSEMMTPLHLAASKNSRDCAIQLLDHGANTDVANKSGYTPLHTAIKHNSLEVVRLFKERGVSMETDGSNGIKPLHVATRYNHLDSLQLLLDAGALTNCRAHNGYTPLHVAAQENRINAANLLLTHGAEVNAASKTKVTPLHLACKAGNDKFAKLLLDKGAHVSSVTSSSLTPMHYAAISGKPEVVELLEFSGADMTPRDNNGNTPLHLACYHGNGTLVTYLLKHGADPNVTNKIGMTPLHYSAQNGDLHSANSLLNNGAEPNTLSDDGWSPLCIAQRNGYGELASLLLPLTLDKCLYFPDDKSGSDVDVKSFVFNSPYPRPKVFINLDQADFEPIKELPTDFDDNDLFELDKLESTSGSVTSLGPGVTTDDMRYIRDGEEICFSSYAGLKSSEIRSNSPLSARPISSLSTRPTSPSFNNFLVSFMVDARGGSMYGQRHSGVSVFVPPGCASSPVRVTCRYLALEKLRHPPPLLPEGEDLACRVMEVGPAGHQFSGPVTLKVPHYASLRDGAREIIIMRSEDGRTWNIHQPPPAQEALEREIDASGIFPEDLYDTDKQHVCIVTDKFPIYFALVSRPKRQSETVNPDGGLVTSPLNPDVQVIVPQGAVKRDTQVQLQIIDVPEEMVDFEFGGKARVSPIVIIEPKRRKFHTPVTVKIPLPKQKPGDEYMNTRLLCSVSGDKMASKWEDITDKTPLTIMNNCGAFLTSISAKYWLVRVKQTSDNWLDKATQIQQDASAVPFLAQFVVLGRRVSQREGNFRIFCVTEDRADKIKDAQRNCEFEEITKSQEVEVLQGKPLHLDVEGDLTLAKKHQADVHSLIFHSFRENRLPIRARYTDDFLKTWLARGMVDQAKGRFIFHHTPSQLTQPDQIPVCSLEVYMPEGEDENLMHCNIGAQSDSLELRTDRTEEHISKAELRLTDIADALDTDWIPLALQLGLTPHDVAAIQSDYDFLPEQALVMLHTWVQRYKDKATGNNLEKALKQIKREDVLSRCMYNIRQVTDVHEMAVAKEFLDSNLEAPKDYLGADASSRGSSMQRGVSLDRSYGEHASFKDVSLFDSGSESASLHGKDEFGKDKLKVGRSSDRFIYMDGSKSPSNLTVTPSESDVEFLPTADVCELDAGVEYELEEIWDGTRWKYVTPKKAKDKIPSKEDLKKSKEEVSFSSLTVEPASPTGRTTPIVDVSDTDLEAIVQQNIIINEPDDEPVTSSTVFRGRKAPVVMDVTDSVEIAITNTETSLTSVIEEENVPEDDEREKTPVIDILEDQDYKRTTTDSKEEQLEDGTTLRYNTQTIQIVRPVVEKHFSAGKWREERKELIVGEEIQEEILELAPGVNVEHGSDLESETTVEEFNETLPNGAWIKKKVSRIKVTRKKSPSRTISSPWGDAIGRKIPITISKEHVLTKTQETTAGVEAKVEQKMEDIVKNVEEIPVSIDVASHVATTQSTDTLESVLSENIIEAPEIVEHQEVLPDGTILQYKTITRKVKRPRTRKIVRDGSIVEIITEQELVETTVEDEVTEVPPEAQTLDKSDNVEKSILSVEEFEEKLPDNSILKRKVIRSTVKPFLKDPTPVQPSLISEAKIDLFQEASQQPSIPSPSEFSKEGNQYFTTETTEIINQEFQQKVEETLETDIPPSKTIEVQQDFIEITPEVVSQKMISEKELQEKQKPSETEPKLFQAYQKPVSITELSPEEETVNILTPIESPVTPQAIHRTKTREHASTTPTESPVTQKRGATFLHISPAPVMTVGQTTNLPSPVSPVSGPYELPPITETLGVQEWEDIKSDGTRQCFKIVTKRKMRPIAVMRPALDGNGFIEKIIKKEKIGVEIDEEITEIAPNVVLDEEDDLDKTTSIDEFHETASDGTWVKRKVRRTEIKRSEDVEEYGSEGSISSTEQREIELIEKEFYEQETTDEKVILMSQQIEQPSELLETVKTSESIPVPLPRSKKQEPTTKAWTIQTDSKEPITSTASQTTLYSSRSVEQSVDPILGKITVLTFADQPRVDEREETDCAGGTLRYKILTRNFKKRIFKVCDDGSERLIKEEHVGTEIEEHIEETEAGLKGDDEVGVEKKSSEDEFDEIMPDGTWLKRKVSHHKIYRKRRDDYTHQQLPTPVRSPKIGSKFFRSQSAEQISEPKIDEREEVGLDGTRLKFKVTSRDHVVRVGHEWNRIGTDITEEIIEISPEVVSESEEFTDKVTTVSETEDILPDGSWIKRKVVHIKITKRLLQTSELEQQDPKRNVELKIVQQPIHTQQVQEKIQKTYPYTAQPPDNQEFKEIANVEEHEEQKEDGRIVTFKRTTKKCLRPVTEMISTDGEVVERVSQEVEIGTLVLEETVEYEPGLLPYFSDYTEEQKNKIELSAVCEESNKLLSDKTWLKKRHDLIWVAWKKDKPSDQVVEASAIVSPQQQVHLIAEQQQQRPIIHSRKSEEVSATVHLGEIISSCDVNISEKVEQSTTLEAHTSDVTLHAAPGEFKQVIKAPISTSDSIGDKSLESSVALKRSEIPIEEEIIEETDLDEIFDVIRSEQKTIQLKQKDDKTTPTQIETKIVSIERLPELVTTIISSAKDIVEEVKQEDKNVNVTLEKHEPNVESVLVIPDESETCVTKPADCVMIEEQGEKSHDVAEIKETQTVKERVVKPQHFEEYIFETGEEKIVDDKTQIEITSTEIDKTIEIVESVEKISQHQESLETKFVATDNVEKLYEITTESDIKVPCEKIELDVILNETVDSTTKDNVVKEMSQTNKETTEVEVETVTFDKQAIFALEKDTETKLEISEIPLSITEEQTLATIDNYVIADVSKQLDILEEKSIEESETRVTTSDITTSTEVKIDTKAIESSFVEIPFEPSDETQLSIVKDTFTVAKPMQKSSETHEIKVEVSEMSQTASVDSSLTETIKLIPADKGDDSYTEKHVTDKNIIEVHEQQQIDKGFFDETFVEKEEKAKHSLKTEEIEKFVKSAVQKANEEIRVEPTIMGNVTIDEIQVKQITDHEKLTEQERLKSDHHQDVQVSQEVAESYEKTKVDKDVTEIDSESIVTADINTGIIEPVILGSVSFQEIQLKEIETPNEIVKLLEQESQKTDKQMDVVKETATTESLENKNIEKESKKIDVKMIPKAEQEKIVITETLQYKEHEISDIDIREVSGDQDSLTIRQDEPVKQDVTQPELQHIEETKFFGESEKKPLDITNVEQTQELVETTIETKHTSDETILLSEISDRHQDLQLEEILTKEVLQTSPSDDASSQKPVQFHVLPGDAPENLSFEFHPVQEQVETAVTVEESIRKGADIPHASFSSTSDLTPSQSEKDLQELLAREKLESYERAMRNLEHVLENETETKYRSALTMVRAMLHQVQSGIESTGHVESPVSDVEKPLTTPLANLLQKFFSEPELHKKVLTFKEPERIFYDVPEYSEDETKTPEELGSSILKYFEASGNILEEKVLSTEESDLKIHEQVVTKSDEYLENLIKSVIDYFSKKEETKLQDFNNLSEATTSGNDKMADGATILSQAVPDLSLSPIETLRGAMIDVNKTDEIEEEKHKFEEVKTTSTSMATEIDETSKKSDVPTTKASIIAKPEITDENISEDVSLIQQVATSSIQSTEQSKIVEDKKVITVEVENVSTLEISESQVETLESGEAQEEKFTKDEQVSNLKVVGHSLQFEKDETKTQTETTLVQETSIVDKVSHDQGFEKGTTVISEVTVPANVVVEATQIDNAMTVEKVSEINVESRIDVSKITEDIEKINAIVQTPGKVETIEEKATSLAIATTESSELDQKIVSSISSEEKEVNKIKMISAEIIEDHSTEVDKDDQSTVVEKLKTTVSTALATVSSSATTIDITTTVMSTTTTTTTSSLPQILSDVVVISQAPTEALSTQQMLSDTSVIQKSTTEFTTEFTTESTTETTTAESSEKSTLAKTLETDSEIDAKHSELLAIALSEEEQGITYETVEGDVRCKVEESEKHELSEDGKKSVTRKVMTRNYYQSHIKNKIKEGIIIAVQPIETFVGKCIDECIFESPTDIKDPYAADVETTTSIDESEETLDDGTWIKKKTTTVVAYLAHEELDSPSIFLEAVTLPKSPKPTIEEQCRAQEDILESFGMRFPEFFQPTENIDNVKMRIIRLADSKPKLTTQSSSKPDHQVSTSVTSATKTETKPKREGKPPSFVLPEARSTRTTPPFRPQTDVMSTTSTGSKRLLRSRVRRTITRKIRKVLHSGEVVEDVVTEEIPDVEMSETSSIRSNQSDFMSPLSSSVASPPDVASPCRRKGSASSHSSLKIYTDTVEGQPEVITDVQEREETLPDGRVIVRKIIKTKQKQTTVKRIVLEAAEDESGDAEISALLGEEDPSIRMYADSLLQESDQSRRAPSSSRGQTSYVDEWLQQAVAASGEVPPTSTSEPSTGPVVVSKIHSAGSSKPKYRVSMERTDEGAPSSGNLNR